MIEKIVIGARGSGKSERLAQWFKSKPKNLTCILAQNKEHGEDILGRFGVYYTGIVDYSTEDWKEQIKPGYLYVGIDEPDQFGKMDVEDIYWLFNRCVVYITGTPMSYDGTSTLLEVASNYPEYVEIFFGEIGYSENILDAWSKYTAEILQNEYLRHDDLLPMNKREILVRHTGEEYFRHTHD